MKSKEYNDLPMTSQRARMIAKRGEDLIQILTSMSPDVDLPEWIQAKIERAWSLVDDAYDYLESRGELTKGAQHKYTHKRRVGTDRKGRPKWRYFYNVRHGGGIGGAALEVKGGEAFQLTNAGQRGHFHVQRVRGNRVTVRHDETGHEVTMSKRELQALLMQEHGEKFKRQKKKPAKAKREKKKPAREQSTEVTRGADNFETMPEVEAQPKKPLRGKGTKTSHTVVSAQTKERVLDYFRGISTNGRSEVFKPELRYDDSTLRELVKMYARLDREEIKSILRDTAFSRNKDLQGYGRLDNLLEDVLGLTQQRFRGGRFEEYVLPHVLKMRDAEQKTLKLENIGSARVASETNNQSDFFLAYGTLNDTATGQKKKGLYEIRRNAQGEYTSSFIRNDLKPHHIAYILENEASANREFTLEKRGGIDKQKEAADAAEIFARVLKLIEEKKPAREQSTRGADNFETMPESESQPEPTKTPAQSAREALKREVEEITPDPRSALDEEHGISDQLTAAKDRIKQAASEYVQSLKDISEALQSRDLAAYQKAIKDADTKNKALKAEMEKELVVEGKTPQEQAATLKELRAFVDLIINNPLRNVKGIPRAALVFYSDVGRDLESKLNKYERDIEEHQTELQEQDEDFKKVQAYDVNPSDVAPADLQRELKRVQDIRALSDKLTDRYPNALANNYKLDTNSRGKLARVEDALKQRIQSNQGTLDAKQLADLKRGDTLQYKGKSYSVRSKRNLKGINGFKITLDAKDGSDTMSLKVYPEGVTAADSTPVIVSA